MYVSIVISVWMCCSTFCFWISIRWMNRCCLLCARIKLVDFGAKLSGWFQHTMISTHSNFLHFMFSLTASFKPQCQCAASAIFLEDVFTISQTAAWYGVTLVKFTATIQCYYLNFSLSNKSKESGPTLARKTRKLGSPISQGTTLCGSFFIILICLQWRRTVLRHIE